MAQFSIEIPDELLPALAAEFSIVSAAGATQATSPEEYFQGSVVEIVRQRAQIYKVGPYYVGPIEPAFNADGTPNVPPAPEPPVEEPPADPPIAEDPPADVPVGE